MNDNAYFALGFLWDETNPNSEVGFYTSGGEIFHGTLHRAKSSRDFLNANQKKDPMFPNKSKYRIFQIVPIQE